MFQYRALFFGELYALLVFIDENFSGGTKLIRTDIENGVVALFMLAQMRPQARQQNPEMKGLRVIVIGSRIEA